jgi:type II secretory pathway pseudopilin PulG
MTLLEALVALVILGASAAGFLGVFQNSARSVQSAESWNQSSALAASTLEDAVRAAKEGTAPDIPSDARARVDLQPWSATVDDIVVSVTLPDGRTMTVHRLVRQARLGQASLEQASQERR